jgi:hypothetical protein
MLFTITATASRIMDPVSTGVRTNTYPSRCTWTGPSTAMSAVAPAGGCKQWVTCKIAIVVATATALTRPTCAPSALYAVTPTDAATN